MNFDEAFERLLIHEGGYSDHAADPGGKTMFGITEAVAREWGYVGPMYKLPKPLAKEIYRNKYWDAVKADKLPEAVRYAVFDAAVNSGPSQSVKWLQEAIGATPDGVVGPQTIRLAEQSKETAKQKMLGVRLEFLTNLKTWPSFSLGWARRLAKELQA